MAKRQRTATQRAKQAERIRSRPARGRILLAARELATTQGYEAVKVGELAEAAKVSRETFYTHFADKRACLAEATEPDLGEIETKLRAAEEAGQAWAAPILAALDNALADRFGSQATPRGRLLAATLEQVAEKGYATTRLVDVIKAAHVSYPAFYRQFETKRDCFAAAYEALIARLEAQIPARLEARGDADDGPTARLICLAEILAAEPATARMLVVESGNLPQHDSDPASADPRSFAHLLGRLIVGTERNQESEVVPTASPLYVGAALELIRSSVVGESLNTLPERMGSFARLNEFSRCAAKESNRSVAAPRKREQRRHGSSRGRTTPRLGSARISQPERFAEVSG